MIHSFLRRASACSALSLGSALGSAPRRCRPASYITERRQIGLWSWVFGAANTGKVATAMAEPLTASQAPLVWIDCEMTGLDPSTDEILQIYCFCTDGSLNLLESDGWGCVVHHPDTTLSAMGEWCVRTHAATGLTAAVHASSTTPSEAAAGLLAYVQRLAPEPRTALLAGNSVHADKAFLAKPPYDSVLKHLHYRILDVSSIKEAARRWAPEDALQQTPRKEGRHEAKTDILESIEEARFYRDRFFRGR